jgi:hypothetical protein
MNEIERLTDIVNNFHNDPLKNPRYIGSCQVVAGELQVELMKQKVFNIIVVSVWVEFKRKDGVEGDIPEVLLCKEEVGDEMIQPSSIPHANEDVYHIIMDIGY